MLHRRQLRQEALKLGQEFVRGDDDGAAGLAHGVQDALLPEVGVHRADADVLGVNSIESQQTFQPSFQQSFYSVANPVVLKTLLKSLLRFN